MPAARAPRSRWNDAEARSWAARCQPPELGLRVYTSRLLGADSTLVLAGGGNTSAKATVHDVHGEALETLFVKGSGSDLASAEAGSFTGLALAPTLRLLDLGELSDSAMMRELRRCRLDPAAPDPSVEALLHAFLPFRFVDHAHPDALLAWIDTPQARARAEELFGEDCLIVPYVKPGFDLAKRCREQWRRAAARGFAPRGMVLEKHGLFAFADDARESYERLLELVGRAARRLPSVAASPARPRAPWSAVATARLRRAISSHAGRTLALIHDQSRELLDFLARPDLARVSQRGPLTPDHVLRTKRLPLLLAAGADPERAVAAYAARYAREFETLRAGRALARLDAAPRLALVPGVGLFAAAPTPREARIAAEIYRHTAWAIARAEALGGYRPLAAREIFEVEYWELEQAKLRRAGAPKPLAGRAALVTGAASGIGRATAEALLAAGAAVVGLDLAPSALPGEYLGLEGDATSPRAVGAAIAEAARRFGGLDIAVANVGAFTAGRRIADLDDAFWRRSLAVNLDAHLVLLREAAPLLALAPGGGAVVVIGSKNVRAPGVGAAAYSAAKAALTQLARVAALELAPQGVRVNVLHPDAVFDTGVWTPEVLAERAAAAGLTLADYRRRNLLGAEIRAADVGALAAALASDLFAKVTGAQIPIDGGNERTI